MPYGYLIMAAVVVLALRHIRSAYATPRSKTLVGGLATFSILAPFLLPRLLPNLAILLVVCEFLPMVIAIYIAFYDAVNAPFDELGKAPRPSDESNPVGKTHCR